jgi:hypothetical protein
MVNARFPARGTRRLPRHGSQESHGKTGVRSVNQSFSKPFEFSENSRRIRFECAQKRERGLQACLLLVCHAAK